MTPHSHCGYCRQVFPTADIEEWVDGGHTPVCPRCGVDSVQPGEADPMDLLEQYRAGFGHRPCDDDPETVRTVQAVSERLTRGETVPDADLLAAIEARARFEAEAHARGDDDDPTPWILCHHLDAELKHHRARFLALPADARWWAWRAGGDDDRLPYWCAEEAPPLPEPEAH